LQNNRWRFYIYIGIFAVVLNALGIWAVRSDALVDKDDSVREFEVKGVQVEVINSNGYDVKLVSQVEDGVKESLEKILPLTEGLLTPKKLIKITLAETEEKAKLNLPAYATSTLYNPEELYMEDWNFDEMMLYAMFGDGEKPSPLQTIGLGEYLLYEEYEGDIYSPHEMWIVHSRHNYPSSLEELIDSAVYNRRILFSIKRDGYGPYSETAYWKVASFANYLIEKHGVEKFLPLYKSTNIKEEIEKVYGITFEDLEAEWTSYVKGIETGFPEKYGRQLEEDYQYWYEN
jgi:hypothetical protein